MSIVILRLPNVKGKQKFVHKDAQNVEGRHFNVGEGYARQFATIVTAMCKYTAIAAAVVGARFDTTPKG